MIVSGPVPFTGSEMTGKGGRLDRPGKVPLEGTIGEDTERRILGRLGPVKFPAPEEDMSRLPIDPVSVPAQELWGRWPTRVVDMAVNETSGKRATSSEC